MAEYNQRYKKRREVAANKRYLRRSFKRLVNRLMQLEEYEEIPPKDNRRNTLTPDYSQYYWEETNLPRDE